MTDLAIKLALPDENIKKKLQQKQLLLHNNDNIMMGLAAFNTDGKKEFSVDELFNAYNYFLQKEKEIAVAGKKGDFIITDKDIKDIIKKDSKFKQIKEYYKDDSTVTKIIAEIVAMLSGLFSKELPGDIICSRQNAITCLGKNQKPRTISMQSMAYTETSEIRDVGGQKIKIYKDNLGREYAKSSNDKYVYINKDKVAKYLGYKTESSSFARGDDKYYTLEFNGVSPEKQYKIWDEEAHLFKNGDRQYINISAAEMRSFYKSK